MNLDPYSDGLWFIQPDMVVQPGPIVLSQANGLKSVRQIQREECLRFDISMTEMLGNRRYQRVAMPRWIAMARCVQERPDMTLTEIAKQFKKTRNSVMKANQRYGLSTGNSLSTDRSRLKFPIYGIRV